ncbi:hypothetical protein TELCIR_23120 [Teladorsagia circumcincta]|uniref:Uncharacterized protein n=1 Tax=Teladorsagia circumcincta TaxID=45464 RepID=A0A2G9TC15_TELCI|nr:hypothetical protein TELCIR_23120 [Teladorsagia circumcincta]
MSRIIIYEVAKTKALAEELASLRNLNALAEKDAAQKAAEAIMKESLGHILEFVDVGIPVKGSHYPPGNEPKDGERKLYLLLEARQERNLKCANEEIIRIMKDAFRLLTAQMQRAGPTGRYKVFWCGLLRYI